MKSYNIKFINLPVKDDRVFVDVYFNAGRIYENKLNQGIGHLLDHYINGRVFEQQSNPFNTNAHIDQDFLSFSLVTDNDHLLNCLEQFISNITSNDFEDEEMLKYERLALINELRSDEASVYSRFTQKAFSKLVKGNHALALNTYREADNVAKFTLKDLKSHKQSVCYLENARIFIGGYRLTKDIKDNIVATINNYLPSSGKKAQSFASPSYVEPGEYRAKTSLNGQVVVRYYFPIDELPTDAFDRIVLNLGLETMVGASTNGSLNKIRKIGVYGAGYTTMFNCTFSIISVGFVALPEQISKVREIIDKHLSNLSKNGIHSDDIQKGLKYIKLDIKNILGNNSRYYRVMKSSELLGGSILDTDVQKRIFALKSEDVAKVFKKYLSASPIVVSS